MTRAGDAEASHPVREPLTSRLNGRVYTPTLSLQNIYIDIYVFANPLKNEALET